MKELKRRVKPHHLQILEALKPRIVLSKQKRNYYYNLLKGFNGECDFDELIRKLTFIGLVLNDLRLQAGSTIFQIDSLIITAFGIFVYEIKNYEGEFFYTDKKLQRVNSPNSNFENPLLQLNRKLIPLQKLFAENNIRLPITGYVVFVNPEFTLFNAPKDEELVLPTMLPAHLKQLDKNRAPLTNMHHQIAERLLQLATEVPPPAEDLPEYTYEKLNKGLICPSCRKLTTTPIKGMYFKCHYCEHNELASQVILQNIKELQLLFPQKNLTLSASMDWCGCPKNKNRFRKVLVINYDSKGCGKGTYYT